MPARIRFEQVAGVARVTLSHPKRHNAMSRTMWRDLRAVFERIQCLTELRCVLVAGDGAHFCAGGDISEYPGFRFEEASLREFHEQEVWGALSAMLACDVPIVAQIEGNCMGAGVEIASCCDIRLAGESARFGAPIAKLGFPMAPREAALVAREMGLATARQMLLEAAVFSAPDMLQRGFLSRVVADVDIRELTLASVQRICQMAPQAARLNKQTLRALSENPLPALVATAYAYADSPEQREGITAFLEKRLPSF
ncbi:enoyl-CoA hydratase/isomerase family protein [Rhodoferax sp.]|jgi:enoyl-CoA hydratase/carnithine racemase|uniref:enoyl-CoA hydratase/isomerase family protein n=1 Tax=Rhodoferax sp. TaxID=50421 RepID=UPI0027232C47|nr:enoyl-CoA hydratase/isomerase family protein [Rhodoferax sp.]MDO9144267.1 enoyl-CoA hydratase/isomerase family protein [Rhodoferax sp.]MDP1531723.1 enoyl-CoA hydratase/isomerase family protein [Rhodoferax sp.]MDP1944279.1 enoyl-CoA hydratase/isomerase family protein [Rhodoferax sp.]MDP2442367.1 enoyl-CoA hydratase/isomerase family protein [Rhodoferax sp.]MDP3190396.1 enoyl-CoA hydratase/isomerase family protein [Rhodoferax sp.]